MHVWALAVALTLAASATRATPDALPDALPASPPTPAQVMELPAGLRDRLQQQVVTGTAANSQRLDRLVAFIFASDGLAMSYQHDADYPIARAVQTRQANCLSFTLLFLALAHEAGLQAYPQAVGETLAWQQQGGTIYRYNHVNAGVRIGGRRYTVDVTGESVIALRPPTRISEPQLLAHFYNNLALAELARQHYAAARELMQIALALDADNPVYWSNSGVVHLQGGDVAGAELDYGRALQLDPRHANALFNMIGLTRRLADPIREAEFRQRLQRVQRSDPLHQFMQASELASAGDYPEAIKHYRQAIWLHGREHRFHAALAHAYLASGQIERARRSLERALALGPSDARAGYQLELERLGVPPEA